MKQPSGLLAAMVGSLLAVLLAPAPQIARAGADVRDVAVGYDIVCVLKINDSVWCQEGNEAWKEVEFQGRLMENRLKKLQEEEARAIRKIQETITRTQHFERI